MPSIKFNNFPPRLLTTLKQQAKVNGRNLNKEMIAALEDGLAKKRSKPMLSQHQDLRPN